MGFVDIEILGHVATEVVVKQSKSGKDYASFLLIANTAKDKSVPLNVTAFGYGADAVASSGKGSLVLVSGRLEAWSKTEGDPVKYSVSASRVVVPRQPGDSKQRIKDGGHAKVEKEEDDLPF